MSNAMRTGKRWLAGVAAGALGAGVLTFVAAPTASANTLSGVTSPVRATLSGTTLDAVPFARIAWTSTATLAPSDTAVVTLSTAPSANAQLAFGQNNKIGTAVVNSSNVITNADDSDTLATTATGGTRIGVTGTAAAIAVAVNTPGTYGGTIQTHNSGGPLDTIAFSFTTTGKPASMALTPATQSIAVGGAATLVATISDSAGNVTQPATVDAVTLTGAGGTLQNAAGTTITRLVADDSTASGLFDGAATFGWLNGGVGGTYAIAAAPAGTLGAGGVTTQTATVSVSGTVRDDSVAAMVITSPATTTPRGTQPNTTVDIPTGSTTVTVAVTGTTAQAGSTIRLRATSNGTGATPSATAPAFATVTLSAASRGTATFTLGGGASANGAALTIQQVTAGGTDIANSRLVATNANRTVTGADLVTVPGGSIVQTLGTATPVSVEVYDQYGDPVAGATVRAFRTSTSGALLSTAVSNSTGVAAVSVSPTAGLASGAVETYVFSAQPIGAASATTTGNPTLTVTYTTSGAVTSVSVAVNNPSGATSPILNTSPAPTNIPYITVPFNGTATLLAAPTSVWNTTTGAVITGGALSGNLASFTAVPSPANTVTVTTPEGVFVSDSATSLTKNAWNVGTRSLTVNSGQPVYVFATKAGQHEVTFTSGAISTKALVRVATVPQAAYNIALTPATQRIQEGAFGTATLTVTDVFGNPVPGATGTATGGVTLSATGEILLSGLSASLDASTGAAGTATITLIAGRPGAGTITAVPQGSPSTTPAWVAGYVPPTGAPAPVRSASIAVVIEDRADKSIVITGERATVSGKPGIRVEGLSDGIEDGKTVTPFIRFPGETTFTAGSARPVITADEFTWQRKTGKRVTVYVELSDDASIRSNRVTIQAN